MAEKLGLAIVGCGGMGHRHLFGLAELQEAGLSPFELVGACDPDEGNANSLADEAERLLGRRPAVATDLEALGKAAAVDAIDLPASPRVHHTVAVEAMQRGWHVMSEKPAGLTVRACNIMSRAAAEHDKVLSVAENYRRDPINRLGKALVDGGLIGNPRLMIHNTLGGGDRMLISVWRHQKNSSGLILDVGVHFTDIMEYYLGPATQVYAQARLHEKIRHNPMAGADTGGHQISTSQVYARWQKDMPAQFEATAEDAAYGTVLFASGAVCQYIEDHAARGQGIWQRAIFGSKGSLDLPGDRSGKRLRLHLEGKDPIDDGRLLDLVPDFRLDEATAALFGGERLFEYELPFAETDRKLIAVEYHEFGHAILEGFTPEVDGVQGGRSVALAYALLESQEAGRPVTVDEMLNEEVGAYQQEINDSLGI